jgi:hypothetical protein
MLISDRVTNGFNIQTIQHLHVFGGKKLSLGFTKYCRPFMSMKQSNTKLLLVVYSRNKYKVTALWFSLKNLTLVYLINTTLGHLLTPKFNLD